MTTLLGPDDFTGTNGDPWNASNWGLGINPSAGGGAEIQGDQGRLMTGNLGGYAPLDRVGRRALITGTTTADSELVATFTFGAGDAQLYISARATSTVLDGGTEYYCGFQGNTATIGVNVAYSGTTLAVASIVSLMPGVLYKVRFRVVGSTLQARFWQASASEPATWDLDVTDSTLTAAGYIGFSLVGGGPANCTWFVDDVTITDGTSTAGGSGGTTAGGGGGDGTGSTSGGTGGGTAPYYLRLPGDTQGAFDVSRYQSIVMSLRPHEPTAATAPAAFGTAFMYFFDSNGVLIDEFVIRFMGDNGYPVEQGFLACPLVQVPATGIFMVMYLGFDTPGVEITVSVTGSYRQVPAARVFNGGAYFGSSGHGTVYGGGVDGWAAWSAAVPASTSWNEWPYCWNGPGKLVVDVTSAIASPGIDVLMRDAITGITLAGQRGITAAAGEVFEFDVSVPVGPVAFTMTNNTGSTAPTVAAVLTTNLSR